MLSFTFHVFLSCAGAVVRLLTPPSSCTCPLTLQVGAHFIKDAFGNYVFDPLKDQAMQSTLQGTGTQGVANSIGANMDQAMMFMQKVQGIHRMFTQ